VPFLRELLCEMICPKKTNQIILKIYIAFFIYAKMIEFIKSSIMVSKNNSSTYLIVHGVNKYNFQLQINLIALIFFV
jgi:hypothetical protein